MFSLPSLIFISRSKESLSAITISSAADSSSSSSFSRLYNTSALEPARDCVIWLRSSELKEPGATEDGLIDEPRATKDIEEADRLRVPAFEAGSWRLPSRLGRDGATEGFREVADWLFNDDFWVGVAEVVNMVA